MFYGYHNSFAPIFVNFLRWRRESQRPRCQRMLRRQRLGRLLCRSWLSLFCVLFQPSRHGLVALVSSDRFSSNVHPSTTIIFFLIALTVAHGVLAFVAISTGLRSIRERIVESSGTQRSMGVRLAPLHRGLSWQDPVLATQQSKPCACQLNDGSRPCSPRKLSRLPSKLAPLHSTVASANAAAVDNHPRPDLLREPYVQRHKISCRTIVLA